MHRRAKSGSSWPPYFRAFDRYGSSKPCSLLAMKGRRWFRRVAIDSDLIIEARGPIVRAEAHTIDVEPVAVVDFLVPEFRVLLESRLLLQPVNRSKSGCPRLVRANKEDLLIAGTQSRKVV
jgi:hypothetical protein